MDTESADPAFSAGSLAKQAAAAVPSLPPMLEPDAAAQQLGSCTLLLLGLPAANQPSPAAGARDEDGGQLQIGFDCAVWRGGHSFSGVKCIQPGCHFLRSCMDKTEVFAPELEQHAAAAEEAVAGEAAASVGAGRFATTEAGILAAPAAGAARPREGVFECMYTTMRVEEAIGGVDQDKRGGMQRGEFIFLEPHAVCVRRWDRRSKTFLRLIDEEEEQRYIRAVKRLEFDNKLGVYPQQVRKAWGLLTDFISPQCLRRLEPLSSWFTAAALPLSNEEQQRIQQGGVVDAGSVDFFVDIDDAREDEEGNQARRLPPQEEAEETGVRFYFTEIPSVRTAAVAAARRAEVRAKQCGATSAAADAAAAAALTDAAVDRTDTLLQVLKKINKRLDDLQDAYARRQCAAASSHRTVAELLLRCAPLPRNAADAAAAAAAAALAEDKREEERLWRSLASSEACQDLLGEVQLSYLAFLLGQRYDGFEQWKQLLGLLSQCSRAVHLLPEFYASLLRVVYCQIEQCPDDFLRDPLLQRSFLVASAASLVNICSNIAPLEEGATADNNRKRGALLEEEDLQIDRAERKTLLRRVERRAGWLQQLLSQTFNKNLLGSSMGTLSEDTVSAAAVMRQRQQEGFGSTDMCEDEEDGPVVVDEIELLRAGVLLDQGGNRESQRLQQQQASSSSPAASTSTGVSCSYQCSGTGLSSCDGSDPPMQGDVLFPEQQQQTKKDEPTYNRT